MYWEAASIAPVRDARGKITHYIAIKEDITERKRLAEEIAQFRHFLERIINAVGDPIFVKDRQHRLMLVNDADCAWLHRDRRELLGKTVRDFFPQEQAEAIWAKDEQIFNTGRESTFEETLNHYAETRHTTITRKSLYRNEQGEEFIVGVLHDITERKAIEAALQEREEQLLLFVKHSPAAIAMLNRDMKYLVVSQRWMQDYHLGDQAILGRSHYDVFPEIPARWREIHQRCLAGAVEKCERRILFPAPTE